MKGTKSIQTEKVESFIAKLKQGTGVPVIPFDERLSTVQSEKLLISTDMSRKKRKSVVDKIAAQIVLQTYLELSHAQNNKIE